MPTEQELKDIKEAEAAWEEFKKNKSQKEKPFVRGLQEQALDATLRAIDFAPGLTRVGIEAATESFNPESEKVVSLEDLKRSAAGKAPTFGEFTKRRGMEPGVSDTLMDIVADPTLFISPAARSAATAAKAGMGAKVADTIINPLARPTGALGKQIYKLGFERADRALKNKFNKNSIADLLMNERFVGGMDEASKKAAQMNEQFGSELGRMREFATSRGAMGEVGQLDEARKVAEEYLASPDPENKKIGINLLETIQSYEEMGPKYPTELARENKLIRRNIGGDTAFDAIKSSQDKAKSQLGKALMGDLVTAEEGAIQKVLSPEEFQGFQKLKEDYGITSPFAQKELNKMANLEASRTGAGLSSIDTAIATGAAATGNPQMLMALAGKKAKDIFRATPVKTAIGLGLQDLASQPVAISPLVWAKLLQQSRTEKENGQE